MTHGWLPHRGARPSACTPPSCRVTMPHAVAGMMITDELGSVARTVLEAVRTLFVWLLNLSLFYAPSLVPGAQLGEPWTRASWLQALGFAVIVASTAVYSHADAALEKDLQSSAAAKAHGEQVAVPRRRMIKSTYGMPSVVWTAMVVKGAHEDVDPVRARWAKAVGWALLNEHREQGAEGEGGQQGQDGRAVV